MKKKPPRADCERQGCGAYHDICERFANWKKKAHKEEDSYELYKQESIARRKQKYGRKKR